MIHEGIVECDYPFAHLLDVHDNVISKCTQTYARILGRDYEYICIPFLVLSMVLFCAASIQTFRVWASRRDGFTFKDMQLWLHVRVTVLFSLQVLVFVDPFVYGDWIPISAQFAFGNLSAYLVYSITISIVFKWVETAQELSGSAHIYSRRTIDHISIFLNTFLFVAIVCIWTALFVFTIEFWQYEVALKSVLLLYSIFLFVLNLKYGYVLVKQSSVSTGYSNRTEERRRERTRKLSRLLLSSSLIAAMAIVHMAMSIVFHLKHRYGIRAGQDKPDFDTSLSEVFMFVMLEILTLSGGVLVLYFFSKLGVEEESPSAKWHQSWNTSTNSGNSRTKTTDVEKSAGA